MINFSDKENINKLIDLEKISLTSTLDIQKNLNKQILIFVKNLTASIKVSFDNNPDDKAFFYLNEATLNLNRSNENIGTLNGLLDTLENLDITNNEDLENDIQNYNENFKTGLNSIFSNTEIIEKFIFEIATTDVSDLSDILATKKSEQKEEAEKITSDEATSKYLENTLVISETQKRVILPYNVNTVQDIFLNNNETYDSIQDVIDKLYTKPISYYRFSPIARFKEAYKLVKEKENGSTLKALSLASELLINYNLHPAVITACKTLDELDIYLACLEDNTLEDFRFFKVKYEIPPTLSKPAKDFI